MFKNPIYRFICGTIICLVVCVFIGMSYQSTKRIEDNSDALKGVVTSVFIEPYNGDVSSESYHTIEYDHSGQHYSESTISCDHCEVGDTVNIIVNKNNPSQFRLESDISASKTFLILLVSVLISILFSFWNFRRYLHWRKD